MVTLCFIYPNYTFVLELVKVAMKVPLLKLLKVSLCTQYIFEALFQACRLLSYGEKPHSARPLYRLHDLIFVLARLGSISLAVLVFWYGLAQAPKEYQVIDIAHAHSNL